MLFLFYLFQENRTAFVRPCQKKSIFPDTRWQTDWWPVSGRTQLALFHSYTVQGTSCAWLNDFIMKLRKSHLVTAEWIRAMMVKLGGVGATTRGPLTMQALDMQAVVCLKSWHKDWICPIQGWKCEAKGFVHSCTAESNEKQTKARRGMHMHHGEKICQISENVQINWSKS